MQNIHDAKKLLSDLTLLYVEDEETLRVHTSFFYQKFFKEVYIAQNGSEGLEFFKRHSPDIIITDINMPVMNGIDMAKGIKALDTEVPIIVLTAFSDEPILLQVIDIGVDAFLNKPADFEKNLETLLKTARNIKTKRELAEKNALLIQQARNAAIGEILSQVAHHWRQPFSTLSLLIQKLPIIQMKGKLDSAYLENVVNESTALIQSMSKTIELFTSFSKQSDGTTAFNLKEATEEALGLILPQFALNSIGVETDIDASLHAMGSKSDFQQSLLKILTNAKDALTEKAAEDGKIVISAQTADDRSLSLKISDNGGGIAEGEFEKIFDPYFTTRGLTAGRGLGLYVVKMIVEDILHGTITAENNEEGATFTLTLRLAPEDAA